LSWFDSQSIQEPQAQIQSNLHHQSKINLRFGYVGIGVPQIDGCQREAIEVEACGLPGVIGLMQQLRELTKIS